jgi:hypothetical protein
VTNASRKRRFSAQICGLELDVRPVAAPQQLIETVGVAQQRIGLAGKLLAIGAIAPKSWSKHCAKH